MLCDCAVYLSLFTLLGPLGTGVAVWMSGTLSSRALLS